MLDRQIGATDLADQPSLLGMLTRYWYVNVLILAGCLGLAIFLHGSQPSEYEATAGLIVEDPRASQLFEVTDLGRPSTQASERYLADQVEILRSTEAATLASELLDERFSPRFILRNRGISGELTSNLINVSFTASSPEDAKAGADALANAYQELRRRQVQETAAVALAKVDALQAGIERELEDIDRQIEEAGTNSASLQELNRQFVEAQTELNQLRIDRERFAVGSPERDEVNTRVAELLQDFATWEAVLRISERGSEIGGLLAEKEAAITEMATLVARANSIEVDAELAAGGVTLFSSAELPTGTNEISLEIVLALALMLGLALSAAVSYYLSLRRNVVDAGRAGRAILDAPLLAEVPRFDLDEVKTPTPVLSEPNSASAEAFRFAASMVDIRAAASDARSFMVVAATPGAGGTAVVANTGSAAAANGLNVLLVDADFGTQDLTRLLGGDVRHEGITDVVDSLVSADAAAQYIPVVQYIPVGHDHSVALLSRGQKELEPAAYMRSNKTKAYFGLIKKYYDLVLIDGPPLLQVAYGSTLARYTDGVIVVVEHGTKVARLREIKEHLDLIDTPIVGYVYTKSPARVALPEPETWQPSPMRELLRENADVEARPAVRPPQLERTPKSSSGGASGSSS